MFFPSYWTWTVRLLPLQRLSLCLKTHLILHYIRMQCNMYVGTLYILFVYTFEQYNKPYIINISHSLFFIYFYQPLFSIYFYQSCYITFSTTQTHFIWTEYCEKKISHNTITGARHLFDRVKAVGNQRHMVVFQETLGQIPLSLIETETI